MRASDMIQRTPATVDCTETITAAAQLMTGLHTLPAEADVRDAPLPIFRAHAVRRVPVVTGDRMVGMLTVDDLIVDVAGVLSDVARPVTGQLLFGHPEPGVPAT